VALALAPALHDAVCVCRILKFDFYLSNVTVYYIVDYIMYFVFDTETTGLPIFNTSGFHRFPSFRFLNKYDPARVVSISWIVADDEGKLVKQVYHIIRPLDFIIDNDSKATEIHGITKEIAEEHGVTWHTMYDEFITDLALCDTIVAHNIQFDVSIMLSEMFRYNKQAGIDAFIDKKRLCTMKLGKLVMEQARNPKLCDLYKHLFDEEMTNAHDASYDTLVCSKCFSSMLKDPKVQAIL
jgi:DNA polymerase-3 subunit alpha